MPCTKPLAHLHQLTFSLTPLQSHLFSFGALAVVARQHRVLSSELSLVGNWRLGSSVRV